MLRAISVISILWGCSCVSALAQCAVEPWGIPYFGSNTSTAMSAGSGQPCKVYANVGGTNIVNSVAVIAPPRHGAASVSDNVVTYRSRPGFTGSDSFTFQVSGSGPGGSGSSSVQVGVSVQ
jgi:hypothetical protein